MLFAKNHSFICQILLGSVHYTLFIYQRYIILVYPKLKILLKLLLNCFWGDYLYI